MINLCLINNTICLTCTGICKHFWQMQKKNSLKRLYYAYSNHELILKHLIHVTVTTYCCPRTVLTIWRSNLHSSERWYFYRFGTHGYLTMRYLNLENKPTATQGLTPDIEVSIETVGQNFFLLLFFWLPTRISIDHLSTVTLNQYIGRQLFK